MARTVARTAVAATELAGGTTSQSRPHAALPLPADDNIAGTTSGVAAAGRQRATSSGGGGVRLPWLRGSQEKRREEKRREEKSPLNCVCDAPQEAREAVPVSMELLLRLMGIYRMYMNDRGEVTRDELVECR